MKDPEILVMPYPQAIVVSLRPLDAETIVNLHGGAHVHVRPGSLANNLAKALEVYGTFAISPPPGTVCRCSA